MTYYTPLRAGDLKRKVTIQTRSATKDSFGQASTSWADLASTRAEIEQLSGSELMAAQAQIAETSHRITIRYRTGVTPANRVIYQGRIFNVLSVIDDFTAHRKLVLMCSEGLNQG